MTPLVYFAYGSNMSVARLRARIPAAAPVGRGRLAGHALRFHKLGDDGSAKLDAAPSATPGDQVLGVLYHLSAADKAVLDPIEGRGYEVIEVTIERDDGQAVRAFMYRAVRIDANARPFHWYVHHVLVGAREAALPQAYLDAIAATPAVEDPDTARAAREHAIHSGTA